MVNKQQRIQAAIDALPNSTPGEWYRQSPAPASGIGGELVMSQEVGGGRRFVADFGARRESRYNAVIFMASKDLAEEVARLREIVAAFESGNGEALRRTYFGDTLHMDLPVATGAALDRLIAEREGYKVGVDLAVPGADKSVELPMSSYEEDPL